MPTHGCTTCPTCGAWCMFCAGCNHFVPDYVFLPAYVFPYNHLDVLGFKNLQRYVPPALEKNPWFDDRDRLDPDGRLLGSPTWDSLSVLFAGFVEGDM